MEGAEANTLMCANCEERLRAYDALRAFGDEQGHAVSYVGVWMSDQFVCTCGWKSAGYWDGAEYALDEAQAHLQEAL